MLEICQDMAAQRFAHSYYLSGGTALALQIEHRKSIDLDFFTTKRINLEAITAWLEGHYSEKDYEFVFRKSDQIDLRILDIKVSFIHYPFAIINNLINGDRFSPRLKGLKLSPAREIALMKAYVLGRRTSFRDYIDLYYLLKKSTSLEEIVKGCSKKYVLDGEKIFSEKLFLQQLTYTEDITDKKEALSFVLNRKITVETIEKHLRSQVYEYMRTLGNGDRGKGELR